jgi:hypothetical protein
VPLFKTFIVQADALRFSIICDTDNAHWGVINNSIATYVGMYVVLIWCPFLTGTSDTVHRSFATKMCNSNVQQQEQQQEQQWYLIGISYKHLFTGQL